MSYKLLKDLSSNENYGAYYTHENGSIISFAFDPANRDYQEYLEWVDAGNTIEEAD
jgi:hypothetical protein|tara:strand:+ start:369 stop:536 length:168 start_codon:yes stop_codon:yes gene_type:complete